MTRLLKIPRLPYSLDMNGRRRTVTLYHSGARTKKKNNIRDENYTNLIKWCEVALKTRPVAV